MERAAVDDGLPRTTSVQLTGDRLSHHVATKVFFGKEEVVEDDLVGSDEVGEFSVDVVTDDREGDNW